MIVQVFPGHRGNLVDLRSLSLFAHQFAESAPNLYCEIELVQV